MGEETLAESRLVAKLKAEARVDKRVYLKREYSKEKWGVSLTYSISKDKGLHLIMDDVVESGPAWESGVRKGDVIVTVNDWLISDGQTSGSSPSFPSRSQHCQTWYSENRSDRKSCSISWILLICYIRTY